VLFQLDDHPLELLLEVLCDHKNGNALVDATIGTCWEAGLLDLTCKLTETMKKGIRNEIISRLSAEGITEGPEGSLFVLRLQGEGNEGLLPLKWDKLIDTLYSEAELNVRFAVELNKKTHKAITEKVESGKKFREQ